MWSRAAGLQVSAGDAGLRRDVGEQRRRGPTQAKDVAGVKLAIEDARTGFVWRLMARSPVVQRGLRAAGFHHTTEPAPRPVLRAPRP